MIENHEKRADVRKVYKVPVTIVDLAAGKRYRARMVNYCKNGLYFETDWLLAPGTKISVEMETLRRAFSSKILNDHYRAEIRWHRELVDSLCKHGYGVRYIAGAVEGDRPTVSPKKSQETLSDPRRHPRRSYRKVVFFTSKNKYYEGTAKNISKSGIFIATKNKFTVGQDVKIVIPGTKIDKGVMLKCEVVHAKPRGIGLKFKRLMNKKPL